MATVFEEILAGRIPCDKVYEDDHVLAFRDIAPQAPIHVLVIPKRKITGAAEAGGPELLGRVVWGATRAAELLGAAAQGYRLVINQGEHGGQTVPYLHCHLLAGRNLGWPPG